MRVQRREKPTALNTAGWMSERRDSPDPSREETTVQPRFQLNKEGLQLKVEKTRKKKTLNFRAQRFETDFWRSVWSMDALDGGDRP